jgi:hypothetical protein
VAAKAVQKKSAVCIQTLPSAHLKAVSSKKMHSSAAGSKRSSPNADNDAIVASVCHKVARLDVTEQRRCDLMEQSATKIETAWRRFYVNAQYQEDRLAIIIVQLFVHLRAKRIAAEQKQKVMIKQVLIPIANGSCEVQISSCVRGLLGSKWSKSHHSLHRR